MALLFCDGFDHCSNLLDKWDNDPNSCMQSSDYARRTGGNNRGVMFSNSGAPTYVAYKTLPTSCQTLIIGFGMKLNASPTTSSTEYILGLFDASTLQVGLRVNTDYTLSVFRSSTVFGTSTVQTVLQEWAFVEIKAYIHQTEGTIEVRMNENTVINVTGIDTAGSSNLYVNKIRLSSAYNDADTCFDDFYICDDSGTSMNDFLGDIAIETLMPNGAGANSGFTPSTGTNYENVDEIPANTTDYNSSGTVGAKDTYALQNLSRTTGVEIKAVVVTSRMKKDDAGARGVKNICRVNGTDYQGAEIALSDGYVTHQEAFVNSPDTATTWTTSEIDSLETGVEVSS